MSQLVGQILLTIFFSGLIGILIGLKIATLHQHYWEKEYESPGHWTVFRCKTCWKLMFQIQPFDYEYLHEELGRKRKCG